MLIDCFTFYNELDLLRCRLAELAGVVDRFVLVEAPLTFTGHAKPLWFAEHRDEFAEYPITHVVVTDMPASANSAWERESFQRNAIMRGLGKVDTSDSALVMVSDVDEIPNASAVGIAFDFVHQNERALAYFSQAFYYYSLQHRLPGNWFGTRMLRCGLLRELGEPQFIRNRGTQQVGRNGDAGWHFSYLSASPANVVDKLAAFSHQEFNKPPFTSERHIADSIDAQRDFLRGTPLKVEQDISTLPEYIQENLDKYAAYLYSRPTYAH